MFSIINILFEIYGSLFRFVKSVTKIPSKLLIIVLIIVKMYL